jgi:AraC-like DNA-binding protein
MGFVFASAGLITGIFYIFIILLTKTNHQNKWWLIFFIALLNLTLAPVILMNSQTFPPIWLNVSFGLLWGPALYFYVVSLLKEKLNYKWLILHLLPFLIYFSLSLIYTDRFIPGPPDGMAPPHLNTNSIAIILFSIIQSCSLVGYSIFTLFVLNKHQKNIQNHYSYKDVYLTIRWSYVIIIFFVSAYVLVVIAEQFIGIHLHIISRDVQTILIALFIYLLGYLGIQQQPVYLNMLDDVRVNLEAEMQKQTGSVSKEKYVKNKLDDELKETYKTKLLNYLEKEKPYLQAKLCINDLSESLQIPKHFLSQIINDSLGHTFYSLINYYRVNEVKRRIIGDEQERFTLLAIAYDSGFNSKSGFNQNFKLETGMTPMEFKNKTKASTTDN